MRFVGLFALVFMIGQGDVASSQCVDGTCYAGPEFASACPSRSVTPSLDADASTPHPAVVRISNEQTSTIDYATGTLVHVAAKQGWVLTVSHLVREGEGRIRIQLPNNGTYEATTVAIDTHWDLALLKFEHDGSTFPCVELSESSAYQGDRLVFTGYGPHGVYRACRGSLVGYVSIDGSDDYEVFCVQGVPREGDSGGPVFDTSGRLAGVVWGTDDRTAFATYSGRIRRFLASALREDADSSSSVRSGIGNVAHDENGSMEREFPMPGESEAGREAELELTSPSTEPASGQGGPDAAPLLDIGSTPFEPLLDSVVPETVSPIETEILPPIESPALIPPLPPLGPAPLERFAIEERNDQEKSWASSLASWGAPALLAALGWTGPPSAAAIFALRLFLARRDRQRNATSRSLQSVNEEAKRQTAPIHGEYARELAEVYALSGRNASADALLGREFEHELMLAEQSSDAGVAKWARKLRNRVSQRFQRICVERPLPAEPPEDDERL